MCGATKAQTEAQQQQAAFYSTLQQSYATTFAQDQGILTSLNTQLAPIIAAGASETAATLAAGPSQQGFSAGEVNDLNTQADENTAAGYRNASQVMREDQAAAGGGNSYLPSGSNVQLQGELADAASGQDAGLKNQINLDNYQQGNANYNTALSSYNNAVSGEEGIASLLNPTGVATSATGAGEASSGTANQIASQSNSVWTGVMGALGGIASTAASSFTGFGGGSSVPLLNTGGGAPLTGIAAPPPVNVAPAGSNQF